MFEDVEGFGSLFSLWLVVNYLFNFQYSLCVVYLEVVWLLGMYENDVDWCYWVCYLILVFYGQSEVYYFVSVYGFGDLGKEYICLCEIGYNGFFCEIGLVVDVCLFYEEIIGLISDLFSVVDFSLDNGDCICFFGVEGQFDWCLGLCDCLCVIYVYFDYDVISCYDWCLIVCYGGLVGWMYDWG